MEIKSLSGAGNAAPQVELPPVYWHGMLKGREWFVKPHLIGR